MNANVKTVPAPTPWWRVGMVWLVLAGPAAVVLAGIVTLKIALTHVDPVVQVPAAVADSSGSMSPALKARNHAATPTP
ncbi:nitrogen fixation protein FixH [Piscinibacter sp. HJYY11]|uniref:nitrogen fixation protein FixH n=1 Tax=Piscinibacter sp. HJYY11 TaxID=2801333 RepID=UPI00191FE2DF|nr:nitrogen fixation protein FixH [Piscinibacter sp. HJYY11]MBL0726413.1 nitrogen fixation protein FixH [Piscinibacter sp. HJYY11]